MIADEDATIGHMPLPVIRAMTPADVDAAAETLLRHDWGDRRDHFTFAASFPGCRAYVATAEGEIVGTSIATISGPAAWLGTIWVDPRFRGAGLGMAMTQTTIGAAEAAGCRTLLLVATDAGRRLYEKIGFEVQTTYRIVEAPGLVGEPDPRVRAFRTDDLEAMAALDRAATGEDRRGIIAALATAETARCLDRADGTLGGFLIRAPWGGGATIAPDPADAAAILQWRRLAAGPDKHVRAGLLAENLGGLERLAGEGWTEVWRAPRMLRGDPLDWDPTAIWGQFNHAMG